MPDSGGGGHGDPAPRRQGRAPVLVGHHDGRHACTTTLAKSATLTGYRPRQPDRLPSSLFVNRFGETKLFLAGCHRHKLFRSRIRPSRRVWLLYSASPCPDPRRIELKFFVIASSSLDLSSPSSSPMRITRWRSLPAMPHADSVTSS